MSSLPPFPQPTYNRSLKDPVPWFSPFLIGNINSYLHFVCYLWLSVFTERIGQKRKKGSKNTRNCLSLCLKKSHIADQKVDLDVANSLYIHRPGLNVSQMHLLICFWYEIWFWISRAHGILRASPDYNSLFHLHNTHPCWPVEGVIGRRTPQII